MGIEKTIRNYSKIYRKALIAGKLPDIETEITSYRARLREMFASDAFKRHSIWRIFMIIKNCIKCKTCGDVIESESRHDFKYCSCKRVAVDGGHAYLRRCFTDSQDDYEELSIIEPDEKTSEI